MVLQQTRQNAAYGYLNEGTTPDEFELFVMIPLMEGKIAQFNTERYISGLTLLNVDLIEDKAQEGEAYVFKQITLGYKL